MTIYEDREKFLGNVKKLIKEIISLGFPVAGSRNINNDTAFEITIGKEEDSEEKLKKLEDFEDLVYDGYTFSESENEYKIIYCQKSPERILRDELYAHLVNLGFLVKEISETSPNLGFLFTVKTEDTSLLQGLGNFKTLTFDGYTTRAGVYDLVYILS